MDVVSSAACYRLMLRVKFTFIFANGLRDPVSEREAREMALSAFHCLIRPHRLH